MSTSTISDLNSTETSKLANINNRITALGSSFPVVTLADGTKAQTGTMGTLLHNIRLYDNIIWDLQTSTDAQEKEKEKKLLEEDMAAAIPLCMKVGLFKLFAPKEWEAGASAGRKFVGAKA